MALVDCPECAATVSEQARDCPSCGHPLRPSPSGATNVIAAIASFLIPGLGQLAQGRLGAALGFFLLPLVLWVVMLGWIGHIWAAVNAARWSGEARLSTAILVLLIFVGLPVFALLAVGAGALALVVLGDSEFAPFIYTLF